MENGDYVIVKRKGGGIALGIVDSSVLSFMPSDLREKGKIPVRFVSEEIIQHTMLTKIAWLVNGIATASVYKKNEILHVFEKDSLDNVKMDEIIKLQKYLRKNSKILKREDDLTFPNFHFREV